MNIVCKTPTTYSSLKKRIKKSTFQYGFALTSGYFVCKGAEEGVSAMLGTVSSMVYLNTLTRRVDNIENSSPFPNELLVPVGTFMFEAVWNQAPFAFDFDYTATLLGFLVYKGALLNLLYDVVVEMLQPEDEIKNNSIELERENES
jgi:hypothetical protein